jgi:hypothetical protein
MANNEKSNRISSFVSNVLGSGLSFDNDYTFSIQIGQKFREAFEEQFPLTKKNSTDNIQYPFDIGEGNKDAINAYLKNEASLFKLGVLCDEISLPGISSATGFIKGNAQGQTLTYAHTKMYNAVSISFLCDRDMTALKFFQFWMDWIHPRVPTATALAPNTLGAAIGTAPEINLLLGYSKEPNYASSTRYFEDYAFTFEIYKMETKYSPQSISVKTTLFDAFPSKISSIPLNSGASSIARVSVDITYGRHTTNFEVFRDDKKEVIERYYGIT